MERLLMRAANVVLSTSTSRGLSEILDEGKRFDWCIVEEASKAHGFDLALPMLASHRMLMIGDHEQLPAFNEAVYLNLLQDPQKVVAALNSGSKFIARKLGFDLGPVESEENFQAFEARCARWHPMVRIFGHIFEESMALPVGQAAIARRLDQQHRMHPEICELVKRCFYPTLQTADVARQRLEAPDPFSLMPGTWLPPHRIVFVDMPYVQTNPKAKGQDLDSRGRMVLSSRSEAKAVIDVLGQLVPQGDCELQILAPYNRQVRVIERELAKAGEENRLPRLSDFRKPRGREQFGSTIDGFQGEEADIIVTSLVRNNHAALTGGVGFLTERPRLNVMLSRARRKLIFVGSWEFFTKRANDVALAEPGHPLHHLAIMFHELSQAVARGSACIVAAPTGGPK
jgi:superfamily I DNA and/or RNA helicase